MIQKTYKWKRILTSVCILLLTLGMLGGARVFAYNDDGTTIPADEIPTQAYVAPTPVVVQPVVEPTTEETKNPLIKEVIEAIDKLPKIEELTIDNKQAVDDIQAKYNQLSDTEKLEVTNYNNFKPFAEKMKVLEQEALKVFSYSFSISKETPKLSLMLSYNGDEYPSFTFVSPSKEEIIVDSFNGSYNNLTFKISDVTKEAGNEETKPATEATTEETTKVEEKKEKTVPGTGNEATTTEEKAPEETTAAEEADKSHTIQIDILAAEEGVWTLKSSAEMDFSTAPYEQKEEKKEEPSTEALTEPETKTTGGNSILNILQNKKIMDIIFIAIAVIAIIIVAIKMIPKIKESMHKGPSAPKAPKQPKQPKPPKQPKQPKRQKTPPVIAPVPVEPEEEEENDDKYRYPYEEDPYSREEREYEYEVEVEQEDVDVQAEPEPTPEPEPEPQPEPVKQEKKGGTGLFGGKQKKKDKKVSEKKKKELGANHNEAVSADANADVTVYDPDGSMIDEDDDIAKLKASVEEMYAKVEQNFEDKPKQQKKSYQIEEEKVQYITQEDIDNDVTIEEYVDRYDNPHDSDEDDEMKEKLKKRRSFFPDSDRFN